MLRKRRLWFSLALTLTFLGLFLYRIDLSEAKRALNEARYIFIAPAVLVYFLGAWFRSLRWRLLVTPLATVSSFRLFPLVLIGFAINNIMPARLGLVARAYLLGRREGVSKIASGTTIAVDQMFDGLALLFSIVIISFFVTLPPWARQVAWLMAFVLGGVLSAFLLMARSRRLTLDLAGWLLGPLPPSWRVRVSDWLGLALSGLETLRSPGVLITVFGISLLVWAAEMGAYYITSLSFGLGLPYHVVFLVGSIANWGIWLGTPGGIGPFEYFGLQALLVFGVADVPARVYIGFLHL
ncbi:MAG: lysylphosphatidylglycerol synthase transmembrane domain-containing protein, partial [Dehalococcoidia bacterium]